MSKKIILLVLTLILVSSCSEPEVQTKPSPEIITYTISEGVKESTEVDSSLGKETDSTTEEDNLKTYTIGEKKTESGINGFREKKNRLNLRYYHQDLEEEEKQRLIEKRTRNWRRVIDDGLIVGYDKEEDELFYKFKELEELMDC